MPDWLDANRLRTVAGACAALSIASAFMIRKIVTKIVTVVLLCGLATGAWVYRSDLEQCANTCSCHLLGHDVKVPHCPTDR